MTITFKAGSKVAHGPHPHPSPNPNPTLTLTLTLTLSLTLTLTLSMSACWEGVNTNPSDLTPTLTL